MYFTFIYPYLLYGNEIWGNTSDCHIKPLILLQKKIVRIICGSDFLAHTTPLFKELKILKIPDIHKYMLGTRMYKLTTNVNIARQNHSYNKRQDDNILPTYQRLSQTQRAVSHYAPRVWSAATNTNNKFAKHIKQY